MNQIIVLQKAALNFKGVFKVLLPLLLPVFQVLLLVCNLWILLLWILQPTITFFSTSFQKCPHFPIDLKQFPIKEHNRKWMHNRTQPQTPPFHPRATRLTKFELINFINLPCFRICLVLILVQALVPKVQTNSNDPRNQNCDQCKNRKP